MLSLDKPLEIDGIAVFRDFSDADQFWYLPGPVSLARDPRTSRARFSFIEYKPSVAGSAVKGGGFAMFETTLGLSDRLKNKILSEVLLLPGVRQPRLSPVIFEEGKVECIALDLTGPGGTVAPALPAGAFQVTEKILGATTPSLDGENRAAFSLTLSQSGATFLKDSLQKGLAPIGALYQFKYSGMRPALRVELTADLELVYQHFSASLEAQYQWVRAGIDAAFETLVQNGAITIKVMNASTADDRKEQENWALAFFKDSLLSKWFVPTFIPGQLATKEAKADPLEAVAKFMRELRGEPPKPVIKPAALTTTSTSPSPLTDGRGVTHTPSTSGTTETIRVTGDGAVVRAGGAAKTLDKDGKFTLEVPAGAAAIPIEVDWPAPTKPQTFHLFHDFDEPTGQGWSTDPPNPVFRAYVEGTPEDDRFQTASGIAADNGGATWTGSEVGRERFASWLKTLVAPRAVEVDAYAGFEAPQILTIDAQREHDMQLSMRRRDVAVALITRGGASLARPAAAHGDAVARTDVAEDPHDRVVRIRGRIKDGQGPSYRGTIARPASDPKDPPADPPKDPKPAAPSSMPGVVSLKLKFVRQEERKKLTFTYDRADAVQRTYAPQGFFGLLLADLANKETYFTQVDLDDPFFRELKVVAEVPVDFERIGLSSAQVALDYGNPANAADLKHKDFVFHTGAREPQEFVVFMNAAHDLDYALRQQFHFSPDSGWDSNQWSYELPPARTEDRTLFVNPYDALDFLEIQVSPGDLDPGVIDSTDVALEATGPGTFNRTKRLVVLPNSQPQVWKLRTPKPVAPATRVVTYALTHHLKDGTTRAMPPETLLSAALRVHDPFPRSLNLEFIPVFDAAATREVLVDVKYSDPVNQYTREERLNIRGDRTESVKLRLAILDPEKREFQYRFTFIGRNTGFDQLAWVTTREELIPVRR